MTLFTTNKMLKQVQHDMRGVLTTSDRHCNIAIFIALALCFLIIPPALSAFQCVECPENFFCKNGQKTACPLEKPVTAGTQTGSEDGCITCYEKTNNSSTAGFKDGICTDCYTADPTKPAWNGSSCTTCLVAEGTSKPVYSDERGGCVSCAEAYTDKPNWNGSACVGCSGDTPYFNPSTLACEACPADKPNWDGEKCVTCAEGTIWNGKECEPFVTITTDTGSFNLMSSMIFTPVALTTEEQSADNVYCLSYTECQEMIDNEKYPEVLSCQNYTNSGGDCWAAAAKHCRDQGKRLPTMEELASVGTDLFGKTIGTYGDYTGGLTIANENLWNILNAYGYNTGISYIRYWSSRQKGTGRSYGRTFAKTTSLYFDDSGARNMAECRAFCIPQ